MIIELEVSEDNKSTSEPWWVIIDPRHPFKASVDDIASMITGPFFSRIDAQYQLENRRYEFGPRAMVYCLSGYRSGQYRHAIQFSKKREPNSDKEKERG